MLQFILGRAATGKTFTVTQRIAECAKKNEKPILLVPEQFSFESEKNILNYLGDGDAQKVTVLSFSRLCDEVERENGGICKQILTDADKIILMNKAIRRTKQQLSRFRRYSGSAGFAKLMVDAVSEFKLNAVSADDLLAAADKTTNLQLKQKLADTALIYSEYDATVSEKFIDNSDRLTRLYYTLEHYNFFADKTVFLDSFKGFTGQQYLIVDRILSQAKNVVISLTDNNDDNRPLGLFANIKKTKSRIKAMAVAHGVDVAEDLVLKNSRYLSSDLAAVEEIMCLGKTNYSEQAPNFTVCRADSVYSEAEFAARNIRRIVRETGANYSDFVIIARDTAPYEDALEIACKKNKISCFIDRRLSLSSMPPVVAVVSAIDVACHLSTEKILRFHKSGVGVLTLDEINTLENYTYLWNIDGSMWQDEWTMNPNGFSAQNGELGPEYSQNLEAINNLRKKAVLPLIEFRKKFSGTAKDMARAVVELFEDCNSQENFARLAAEYRAEGNNSFSDGIRSSWAKLMDILNSLDLCFGDEQITKNEFYDALLMSVNLETVGIIPQMIDEVTFGAADRIRPSRPLYAFILGANQGIFPQTAQSGGLFAFGERQALIDLGIDIPDKMLSCAVDEEFLLYSNVCCASKGLFISSSSVIDGTASEVSSFVNTLTQMLQCNVINEPHILDFENLPETEEAALSSLCRSLSQNDADAATLQAAISQSENINSRAAAILDGRSRPDFSISTDAAARLFGKKIRMSPSKFDTFNRCKFMYFCRYGLRAEPLQSADFNAMQRGTLVHFVLEKAVQRYGKGLADLTDKQISVLVDELIEEYLNLIPGYKSVETPRLKYLVSTIGRTLKYVVGRLSAEFAQSDFEPVKCELKIGYKGDIPEITIPVDDYGELSMSGVIDRLDKWNGYVRIVDYKTGSRDFKLPDILFGQNMQMLIYLYAVTKSEQYGGNPAGIFYMPANRAKDATPAKRRMNGLLVADDELVAAMDRENSGEFVPKLKSQTSDSFVTAEDFDKIFNFIEQRLKASAKSIFEGRISADPVDGDSPACKYCDYSSVCRIENEKIKSVPRLTNAQVISEIERQAEENVI